MGEKVGEKTIDLEWVQVYPIGLVKPDASEAKIKFLDAGALCGPKTGQMHFLVASFSQVLQAKANPFQLVRPSNAGQLL